MSDTLLATLVAYMAGEFENAAQAVAEPAWYVHLRLWQRPVTALSNSQVYTFLLEQANVISGKPPYRQRILQIQSGKDTNTLQGQYFALKEPLKFQGAGADANRLSGISQSDLVVLPNSGAAISATPVASGYLFKGALKDGELCSFEYGGERKFVYLGFDIEPYDRSGNASGGDSLLLKTYDKGIDPDTGRGLWGALMGPFQMIKQKTFDW
ncbi:MAG: chromophore lyase CpcT/CpeT [Cyanobacteria bacterium J06648_10]